VQYSINGAIHSDFGRRLHGAERKGKGRAANERLTKSPNLIKKQTFKIANGRCASL
jgi:hypothetical protein